MSKGKKKLSADMLKRLKAERDRFSKANADAPRSLQDKIDEANKQRASKFKPLSIPKKRRGY